MPKLNPAPIATLTTEDGQHFRVIQERRPSQSYGEPFVIFFTRRLKEAARTIRSAVTLRVLIALPDHLNFVDFRQLHTVELGAELGTDHTGVSRALRELLERGIVEREGTGPRTAWRLSSNFGWTGSADQFHAFRAGRLKGKKPPSPPPTITVPSPIRDRPETQTAAKSKENIKQTRLTLLGVVAGQGAK